jgi:hypothetical protein
MKTNLLPELNDNELDLLLTSIGCALQKCDQLDSKFAKQAEKELIDLYNNIQINSIETDTCTGNKYGKVVIVSHLSLLVSETKDWKDVKMIRHNRKECECCGVEEDLHPKSSNGIYDIESKTIRLEMTYLCTKCKELKKENTNE